MRMRTYFECIDDLDLILERSHAEIGWSMEKNNALMVRGRHAMISATSSSLDTSL